MLETRFFQLKSLHLQADAFTCSVVSITFASFVSTGAFSFQFLCLSFFFKLFQTDLDVVLVEDFI
jgi:hypothetical protein